MNHLFIVLVSEHLLSTISAVSAFFAALGTVILTITAWVQLEKIHEQNDTQILTHLEQEMNGEAMLVARKTFATKFANYLPAEITDDKSNIIVKKELEAESEASLQFILDFFEKLSFLTTRKDGFDFETVYNMYSHYFIHYFEGAVMIGYLEKNKNPQADTYYEHCQKLFLRIENRDGIKTRSRAELVKFFEIEKFIGDLKK